MSKHQNLIREIKAEEARRLRENSDWETTRPIRDRIQRERVVVSKVAKTALRHVGLRVRKDQSIMDVVEPIPGMHPNLSGAMRDQQREFNRRKLCRANAMSVSKSLRFDLLALPDKPVPAPLIKKIRRFLDGK